MQIFLQVLLVGICFLFALPADAHAMHIGEGILPLGWAALWYGVSVPVVALGLYKLKKSGGAKNIKPLLGMVGAAVFVISCMPVPVPVVGSCSHPAGTALAAVMVGPLYGVLAASVSLLLQALLLAHGGISTWGANTLSMGIMGSFAGWLVYKGLLRTGASVAVAAFFAGVAGDWATYATTALELSLALHGPGEFLKFFETILLAFVPTQLPLGVLEGLVTAGAVKFLHSRRPELFGMAVAGRGAGR